MPDTPRATARRRTVILGWLLLTALLAAAVASLPDHSAPEGPARIEGRSELSSATTDAGPTLRGVESTRETEDPPAVAAPPEDGPGIIRIHVVDDDGRPVSDGGRVYLFWRDPRTAGAWQREGVPYCATPMGRGLLEEVPLGKEILLRAMGGNERVHGDTILPGPTRPREVVEASMRLGALFPVVIGRAVREDGEAIRHGTLSTGVARVERGAAVRHARPLQSRHEAVGRDGRFRLPIGVPAHATKDRVLVLEDTYRDAATFRVTHRAEVRLRDEELRSGGTLDLGTLVLRRTPESNPKHIIAEGRICDESDRPLRPMPSLMALVESAESGYGWKALPHARVRLRSDGTFRVTAPEPPTGKVRLAASGHRRLRSEVTVDAGATDVVLRLEKGATLHAWFLIPEGIPPHRLAGYIQRRGGRPSSPNQALGHFQYDILRAGTYDVFVEIKSTSWEVARVSDIHVPAGGEADDPRIRGIPLEGRVRLLSLKVLDPEGKPLPPGYVQLRDDRGKGGSAKVRDGGVIATPVPADIDEFELSHGLGRVRIRWTNDAQEVRLDTE